MYCFQHCFICRPSESTVSEDAGIEPRTAITTLTVRRSNQSAISHPPINFKFVWARIKIDFAKLIKNLSKTRWQSRLDISLIFFELIITLSRLRDRVARQQSTLKMAHRAPCSYPFCRNRLHLASPVRLHGSTCFTERRQRKSNGRQKHRLCVGERVGAS